MRPSLMAPTMSIALHAALLLGALRPSTARSVGLDETTLEISLESPVEPPAPETSAPVPDDRPAAPQVRSRAPESSRAHAIDSAVSEGPPSSSAVAGPAALVVPEAAPTPRFAMVVGGASLGAAARSAPSGIETSQEVEPIPADRATTQARLVTQAPVRYPAQARELGIEAAVTIEIVVDTVGHVRSARVVRPAGRGFDEAALDAIANYRFTPAALDGRPVPVHMRWRLEFKLT